MGNKIEEEGSERYFRVERRGNKWMRELIKN